MMADSSRTSGGRNSVTPPIDVPYLLGALGFITGGLIAGFHKTPLIGGSLIMVGFVLISSGVRNDGARTCNGPTAENQKRATVQTPMQYDWQDDPTAKKGRLGSPVTSRDGHERESAGGDSARHQWSSTGRVEPAYDAEETLAEQSQRR